MKRRPPTETGFVVTPDALKDQINSLDNAVAVLDGDIRASTNAKLNQTWRTEWDAFVRRWALERDAYASWGSRLFNYYVGPRLDAFVENYRWWARDYQRRTGVAPRVAPPAKQESLVPTEVWWILGLAVVTYVAISAGASRAARGLHGE